MKNNYRKCFGYLAMVLCVLVVSSATCVAQSHSIARKWNEIQLEGIRGDYARPTVTARNLHHLSAAMYDAWAAYSPHSRPYFIGNDVGGVFIPFSGAASTLDTLAARQMAISFAAYRLLENRYFYFTPGGGYTHSLADSLMLAMGYDISNTSTDYSLGPAELGNFIGEQIISYGATDNANAPSYGNIYYDPSNPAMAPALPGNPSILLFNSWQPLVLDSFVDQNGFPHPLTPGFQSPEWGNVLPFAMTSADMDTYPRDGELWNVYHDQGPPPYLDSAGSGSSEFYQEGFSMVSKWGSHLDPADGVLWDVSPASIGKIAISDFPAGYSDFSTFYDMDSGGVLVGNGRSLNPVTGSPYVPQIVPRGDYTRVLAEFWADGPDSETPPGHWFTILNKVNDHPLLVRRWNGSGPVLSALDWDIVSYLTLGGAMHDAAIAAWGAKGYYDYIRPISAIRCMADIGQCTDTTLGNYHAAGIPLEPGFAEVVEAGDPLEGAAGEHIGKIKLYTWRGHDFVVDPATDVAGVDWILAENWWPYQRPTFVTPPFAGYISGHSTYSRAAATVLTLVTGDDYFPGGIGEFFCPQNEFLVFEQGPSVDVTLQWATYKDAADECSLSRIWGGIHPPADDIPGRKIGKIVGVQAYQLARDLIFNPCEDDTDGDGICDAVDFCVGPNIVINSITPIDESACRAMDAGLAVDWTGGAGDFEVIVNGLYSLGPFSSGPQNLIGARKGIPINTLTIIDLTTGCSVTELVGVILGGPEKPEIASLTVAPGCFGDGSMVVDVDDSALGTGDYHVRVAGLNYGPFTSEPFTINLPAGSYPNLILKDDNNCVDKDISGFTILDTCALRMSESVGAPQSTGESLPGSEITTAKLHPNPAGEVTYFELTTAVEAVKVSLFDPYGKLLKTFNYQTGSPLRIDLDQLPPGVYMLRWEETSAGQPNFNGSDKFNERDKKEERQSGYKRFTHF